MITTGSPPASPVIVRKLHSARFRARQAISRWRETRQLAARRKKFDAWLDHLRKDPPDVLVGANFAEFGGVRNHLRAIQRYSALRAELAPDDDLLALVSSHEMQTTFREAFFAFAREARVRAAHSHVFPWFVEWCRVARKPGLLWVHTYHLPYFADHSKGPLAPWQDEFNRSMIHDARHADVRLSVSRWQCEWLSENHGIEADYLPNGVDVEACDRGSAEAARHICGDEPFVLYVGRNDPVKNPAEFVALAQRLPTQRFVMIGKELDAATLRSAWGVTPPSNLVLAGEASHGEVQDALAACAAVVVTSKREGLPTLVLEAMAHGKPVVVPRERGCAEAINHGECGHTYEPGELEDLEACLARALGPEPRVAVSRQRILSHYDWRVVAPALDAVYRGSAC